MIWASFDGFLHVFGLHEDGHGSNNAALGGRASCLESHRACCGHSDVQFFQHVRVLEKYTSELRLCY